VIEFYADWCAPCQAFQKSLGDPRMAEALRGTFLVKLNLDDWHDKLGGTGFKVDVIPAFYLVGDDGRPTGKMLDGNRWGRSTVPNMSAALRAFLGP
jgi:thioredoxin-like negative regulator of GroEL